MNETCKRKTVVTLDLDTDIIDALDRGRTDERLSRRSYVRNIVARHLRSARLLASANTDTAR